ncbi:MAG: hypothetical protein AB7R89_03440 [Dehalococcoidia bacterium]
MAQITYEVRLALDGNHSVTVRSADPSQMKVAISWAKATHAALAARYGDTAPYADEAATDEPAEPPVCGVHDIPMVRVEGKNGPFYSCHERDAQGHFCSYRPANGA